MNDTTNTTPGMTVPQASQMPPVPENPPVQPFPAAPASPMTSPAAPTAMPSFGMPDMSTTPGTTTTPSWAQPQTPPVSQNAFAAPAPVAGSATWGNPAPMAAPSTPTWTPQTPAAPPMPTPPATSGDFKPEHEGKSKLPLIIAGILLILAMAGGYFLYMLYQTPPAPVAPAIQAEVTPTVAPSPTMTEEEQAQTEVDKLNTVSESDDVESLQKDVDNTNLSTIDSNLTPAAQ